MGNNKKANENFRTEKIEWMKFLKILLKELCSRMKMSEGEKKKICGYNNRSKEIQSNK